MATDLNLNLPNTAKPINENHAREMLNRTRVWLNCFNLDRSTGSQYGKAPTISNTDYMANHSEDWWCSSPYSMSNFDIHICAYNSELKVMAAFMAKIYSDPSHPTGLNKVYCTADLSLNALINSSQNLDFEGVAAETDEELKRLGDKWQKVLDQTDMTDPQNRFRSGLLKLAFSYARLVALSFGFQHAFGKNNTDENPFLMRVSDGCWPIILRLHVFQCLTAAFDVVTAFVEDVGRPDQRMLISPQVLDVLVAQYVSSGVYLRHGPIAQSVFVTFASSMLVKVCIYLPRDPASSDVKSQLLQPKFASYITTDKRHEIQGLVKKVINLLGSPDVSVDDKHGPNLYARFLKGLLAAPLVKSQRKPVRSNSGQPMEGDSAPSTHTSPDTTHSLSPAPTTAALSFDRFAPPLGGSVDPFMPLAAGVSDGNVLGLDDSSYFPPSLPYNHDPLQSMQSLGTGWSDGRSF
jgi:hypothetical protein